MPTDPPPVLDGKVIASLRAIRRPDRPDLVRELTAIFRSDAQKHSTQLAHHLATGVLHEAANLAHRMKGSAGMIGLMRLAARCAAIEHACRAKNLDQTKESMAGLEADLAEAWLALDQAIGQPAQG